MKVTGSILSLIATISFSYAAMAQGSSLSGQYALQTNDCMPYDKIGTLVRIDANSQSVNIAEFISSGTGVPTGGAFDFGTSYIVGEVSVPSQGGGNFHQAGQYSNQGNTYTYSTQDSLSLVINKTSSGVQITSYDQPQDLNTCLLIPAN